MGRRKQMTRDVLTIPIINNSNKIKSILSTMHRYRSIDYRQPNVYVAWIHEVDKGPIFFL